MFPEVGVNSPHAWQQDCWQRMPSVGLQSPKRWQGRDLVLEVLRHDPVQ